MTAATGVLSTWCQHPKADSTLGLPFKCEENSFITPLSSTVCAFIMKDSVCILI
jgi:hypothetical protein